MSGSPLAALTTMTLLVVGCANAAPTPGTTSAPASVGPTSAAATDIAAVVRGNTRFALDLYAELSAREAGNIFFSPQSVSTALAMTSAGARGETAAQMAQTLHFSLPDETLHTAFGELDDALNAGSNGGSILLATANRLWGRHGEPFLPAYLDGINRHYRGGFQTVDFAANLEASRRLINDWVSHQTLQRIDDLLQAGDLDPASALVLTNAIFFKGAWRTPFDPQYTRPHSFRTADGTTVETPMMWGTIACSYHAADLFQAIELPYDGERLAMLILLPRQHDGLARLEAALTPDALERWLGAMKPASMSVALPRVELESRFDLAATLSVMGMPLPFSAAADFSGMNGRRGLFISTVIHQANLTVNEEGSEAAAATAVSMKRGGRAFRAEHPFLFLVRDRKTGAILFLGRVADPSTS